MKYFVGEVLKYNENTFIVIVSKHEWWTDCKACIFKRVCDDGHYSPYRFSDCKGRYYKRYKI